MFYHGEDGERTQAFPYFDGFHFETKVYELKGNYTQPDSDEGVPELNSYLISWYVNCIKPAAKNDGESDTVMLMDTGNMTQVRGHNMTHISDFESLSVNWLAMRSIDLK